MKKYSLLMLWILWLVNTAVAGNGLITDGDANWADIAVVFEQWLSDNCSADDWCNGADLDHSGEVDFRDFALLAQYWPQPQPRNNLLANGDFETGACEQPWPWTVSYQTCGGNGMVDTSVSHSGLASYKMWGISSNSKFRLDSEFVDVNEKSSYDCSMWIKSNTWDLTNIILYVNYYSANKTLLRSQLFWDVGGTYDWTNKKWTFSTPKNCNYIKIRIFFYQSSGYMYLDDVAIYEVPSPSTSLTWDEIVANGEIAYNHFMNQRDYPYYFSTRYNYQTHTNESFALPYLIHSIYQYLITSDETYLNTAKYAADDMRTYLLGGDNLVYTWDPVRHSRTTPTLDTRTLTTILHSLILLARIDNSYIPLAQTISNGIINNYINPTNNLLCDKVYSSTAEVLFANEEMLIVKDLLMMYELTGNIIYRDKALDILFASWTLRNPCTNLIGFHYWANGIVEDSEMKQGGTGGSFLNSLNYAYYITQDPNIEEIIEDYSQAINNYVYSNQLNAYRYRTYMDGSYSPYHNEYEFCYPWLDDAMIRAFHITNNPTTYATAKSDFDKSFMDQVTVRNFLIVHGTDPDGSDSGNHQSAIFHTFSAPFTGYMMYLETGDESYLDSSIQFYHQVLLKHRRENPLGYITSVDPYTFEDDPYLDYYSSSQMLFLPTIMVPLLVRPVNATVDWNLGFNKPMSGTYLTPVEYQNVSFDYANKVILFDNITKDGFRGRVKVAGFKIKDVKLSDGKYAIYVDNDTFYVNQGTDSYIVSDGNYNSSIPRLSSISDPCIDVLKAAYDTSSGKVQLILDGMSPASLIIQSFCHPFLDSNTTISSDDTATIQVNISGMTDINSVNMSIIPSADSVDVTITDWQTEEPYYKKWTEAGTSPSIVADHTVGDIAPNEYYKIWYTKDGGEKTLLDTKQSNSVGQITFTYTGGYSSVVFEIEKST